MGWGLRGLGLRVQGLRIGVGLGFMDWGLGFGFRVLAPAIPLDAGASATSD